MSVEDGAGGRKDGESAKERAAAMFASALVWFYCGTMREETIRTSPLPSLWLRAASNGTPRYFGFANLTN